MTRGAVLFAIALMALTGTAVLAAPQRHGGGHPPAGGYRGGHPPSGGHGGGHPPSGGHRGGYPPSWGHHGHGGRPYWGGGGWGFAFGSPFPYAPYYGYYAPYPYSAPYPDYAPYPDEWAYPPPPPEDVRAPEEQPEAAADGEATSYGLIQLRGVPDGARIDLDGRFWLKAEQLGERWLALPRGTHTLTVAVPGREPLEREIDVAEGKTQVIRFEPRAR